MQEQAGGEGGEAQRKTEGEPRVLRRALCVPPNPVEEEALPCSWKTGAETDIRTDILDSAVRSCRAGMGLR